MLNWFAQFSTCCLNSITEGIIKDDWEKVEEEEDWDPDFDEFDIPKSKGGGASKASTSSKPGKKGEEDDDFKLDEDFKEFDLFNDSGFDDGDEDDF